MVRERQVFRCLNCGDEIIAESFIDCDSIEGNFCCECGYGVYQWVRPADEFIQMGTDDVPKEV